MFGLLIYVMLKSYFPADWLAGLQHQEDYQSIASLPAELSMLVQRDSIGFCYIRGSWLSFCVSFFLMYWSPKKVVIFFQLDYIQDVIIFLRIYILGVLLTAVSLLYSSQVFDLSMVKPSEFVQYGLACLEKLADLGVHCAKETWEKLWIMVCLTRLI